MQNACIHLRQCHDLRTQRLIVSDESRSKDITFDSDRRVGLSFAAVDSYSPHISFMAVKGFVVYSPVCDWMLDSICNYPRLLIDESYELLFVV